MKRSKSYGKFRKAPNKIPNFCNAKKTMLDKLPLVKERFEEVGQLIVMRSPMADMSSNAQLTKEYKDLKKVVKNPMMSMISDQNLANSKEFWIRKRMLKISEMEKLKLDELRPGKICQLEEET